MRRLLLFILVWTQSLVSLYAQDTITLEQCYQLAAQHFPLAKQKDMLAQSSALEIKKLNTQYMPQLTLNAQATYQSEVPHVQVDNLPIEIPTASKDQYKGTIDLNQVIYDGGATRQQKNLQSSAVLVQQQNIEVQLNQLKSQVSALFFSILLSDAQRGVNDLLKNNIESQLEKVQAAVDNGISLASNADVLKAELIRTRQQRDVINQNKQAAILMLTELTGLSFTTENIFQLPQSVYAPATDVSARPEYKLFQLQRQTLDVQRKAIIAKQLPRLGAFAQGGFGRPGLNLLNPDFAPLYIAGVKLSWSPWHWNAEKFDRQIITINKNIVDSQQEMFDMNSRIALLKQSANIQSLQQQIISDREIISLREGITKSAETQLDNGIITSTDYLTELRAEQQIRLNLKMHEIQLEQAKAEYSLIIGK